MVLFLVQLRFFAFYVVATSETNMKLEKKFDAPFWHSYFKGAE